MAMEYVINLVVNDGQADQRLDQLVQKLNQAQQSARQTAMTQPKIAQARRDAAQLADIFKDEFLNRIPAGGFLQKLASSMSLSRVFGIAAAGLGVLWGRQAGRAASNIANLRDRLDMTMPDIQKTVFAASSTGGKPDAFIRILDNVRKSQSEAFMQGPNGEWAKMWKQLGVTFEQLRNTNAQQLFYGITDGLKSGSINAVNFAAALKVMGEESKTMLPALKSGVREAAAEFERFHLTIRSGTIRALDQVGDKTTSVFSTIWAGLKKFGVETAGGAVGLVKGQAANALLGLGFLAGPFSRPFIERQHEMRVSRMLQFDGDYNDSLDLTQTLENRLAQKVAARDARREEQAARDEALRIAVSNRLPVRESIRQEVDALARYGIYRGGVGSMGQDYDRQTVETLKEMDSKIRSIESAITRFRL